MSQAIGRQEPAPVSKLPRFHTTEADDAAFLAEGYGLKPDPWQKLFLDHAMGRDAKGRMTCTQACLSVPRQNGKNAIIEMVELYQMIVLGRRILHTAHEVKALDIDEEILTDKGWTTMGALKDGDKVYGPDGKLTSLIAHPIREGRPCYELTLDDGQKVVADEDHLWGVTYVSKWGKKEYKVVSTKEIAEHGVDSLTKRDHGRDRHTYHYRIQLPKPVDLPEASYEIDPWLMGAWIGDGTSLKGEITCGAEDLEFVKGKLDALGETYRIRPDRRWPDRVFTVIINDLKGRLSRAGVLGNKHIPDSYLGGSIDQRRSLLAGLLDTDGSSANNQVVLGMMNEKIISQATQLIRSLGYKATNCKVMAKANGREVGYCHRVSFRAGTEDSPFSLPRKNAKLKPRSNGTRSSYNAIVNIRPVPTRRTRCITVDNESRLFLVGRGFIPTHNTARAAFLRIAGFFENPAYPELQEMVDFIRRANGQEEVRLLNGGSVQFGARTQGAGRGFTVDTLIMDEAQDLGDEALAALLPTISSAPSGEPQQIIVGTPPTTKSDSEVWRRLRDNAMGGKNRRSMWCEWSAPESDGPIELGDPDVWAYANPSLGIRLRAEVIEDELSAMEPGVFMRERLGMWSFAGERSVVPIEDWQMCEDRETRVLPQDIERVVLAADITPARDAGALVAAIQTTDGKPPIVDVIDQRAGSVAWIPAKIADVVEKFGADAVIIDGYSPASSLIEDIQARGVGVTKVKVDFVCTAAERFLDSVLTHTVRQLGQGSMQLALSGARKRRVGEGRFAFGRLNSTTDISPLVAATLALNGLDTGQELSRIKYRKKARGGAKKNYRKKVMVM